jgi:hypothetical protein
VGEQWEVRERGWCYSSEPVMLGPGYHGSQTVTPYPDVAFAPVLVNGAS